MVALRGPRAHAGPGRTAGRARASRRRDLPAPVPGDRSSPGGIYHAQQMHVWSTNIVDGIAAALEQAGLHSREERHAGACASWT